MTYVVGNGSTNPKYARLVEYTAGGPSFGAEIHVVDLFGEWSDADLAQSIWTGSRFVISWRWQGSSYVRSMNINGNFNFGFGPKSLGDGLDVEVNPNLACSPDVCLAHGFASGVAFGARGGSWARFFNPVTMDPLGPVFYSDDHAGIMEDQRVTFNARTNQFQLAWVRLRSAVDFRLVAPNGDLGPLDLSKSLLGSQMQMVYNPGTQTSLITMNWPDMKVTAVELGDDGNPIRNGQGVVQSLSLGLDSEGSPSFSMPAANGADAQWLTVYSSSHNGRATAIQGTLRATNYNVSPSTITSVAHGAAYAVSIFLVPGGTPAPWTATTSDPSWLTVSPSGGSGPSTVTFTTAVNPLPTSRSQWASVAGQPVLVTQVGTPFASAGGGLNMAAGPKSTTSHGYYVPKFRVAFDPINRVYLQVWDDPAHGRARGQFLDTLANPIGAPFNVTASPGTGWVNITFGGPANKPRFLVTYLTGNGANNPKFARLVEYTSNGPSFGAENHVVDVFGEWSDADIAQSAWTGSQFIVSWRWQGASYVRGIDIDGNFTVGPQNLGDGLDVEINPNIACAPSVCLAHGYAVGVAFGAVGGSWARFFDPVTLAPTGPVFYSDNHAGLMEDQRVVYNARLDRFQLAWVRQRAAVDFRLVSPDGQVGPLDVTRSLPGGQMQMVYNPGTQTSLITMTGSDIRVTAVELGDNGYPIRNNGVVQSLSLSLDWVSEGSPPQYFSMPAANGPDSQWLVVFSSAHNGRATVIQGLPARTLTLSAGPWIPPSGGGSLAVTVTATNGTAWTVTSSAPSWLTVAPGSGSGSGGFTMTAALNGSPGPRTATITVGDQSIRVFQPAVLTRPAGPPVMHLDIDAMSDVFTYKSASGQGILRFAQSGGGFISSSGIGDPAPGTPYAVDFDGILTDIFFYSSTTGQWARKPNGGGSLQNNQLGTWAPGWQIHVMDLDGDGYSDLFLYDPATGLWEKEISRPAGFIRFSGQWNPNWEITPLNLNGDAFGDMFLFNRTTGRWFWVLGQSGGGFTYPLEDHWLNVWQIQAGDFNGDGLDDLFLLDPATGLNYTCLNTGANFNYFGTAWNPGWTPYVADLDGDGADDLFLSNAATGTWYKMISNKAGAFTAVAAGVWVTGWQIYPLDFNGDSRADLLLYNPATGAWFQAFNTTNASFTYANGFWDTGLTVLVGSPRR